MFLGLFFATSMLGGPNLGQHIIQLKADQGKVFLSKSDNCIGNPDADTVIVDFFDYNCPDCRTISKFLTNLVKTNKNIKVVFVDFPKLGASSTFDAKIALAAKQQNKYPEIHDALIASPKKLTKEQIFALCKKVGLNINKLKNNINSDAVNNELLNNLLLGSQFKVEYVPTIMISKLDTVTGSKTGKEFKIPEKTTSILMNTAKETKQAILEQINIGSGSTTLSSKPVPTKTVELSPELQKIFMEKGQNVIGNKNGNVIIVDFFDYYCSDCRYISNYFEQIIPKNNNVKVVYVDNPILGKPSMFAAKAVLAAKQQNKYMELHNALLASKGKLTIDEVYKICQKLSINISELKKAVSSPEVTEAILNNLLIPKELKVKFVPVILIAKLQKKVSSKGEKVLQPPEKATLILTDAHLKVKQSIESQLAE